MRVSEVGFAHSDLRSLKNAAVQAGLHLTDFTRRRIQKSEIPFKSLSSNIHHNWNKAFTLAIFCNPKMALGLPIVLPNVVLSIERVNLAGLIFRRLIVLRYALTILPTLVMNLFSAGCEYNATSVGDGSFTSAPIIENFSSIGNPRARWESYDFKSYVIEQEQLCFCPPPHGYIRLVIRDNKVVEGFKEDGTALTAAELQWRKTVDELFGWIDEAQAMNPRTLDVEYDSKYGYPTRIVYDQSEFMADEEVTYSLRGLQRVVW